MTRLKMRKSGAKKDNKIKITGGKAATPMLDFDSFGSKSNTNFDDEGEADDLKDVEEFSLADASLNKNKNNSIFKILTYRYFVSAYPLLLRKAKSNADSKEKN